MIENKEKKSCVTEYKLDVRECDSSNITSCQIVKILYKVLK